MSPQPQTSRWLHLGAELKKLRSLAGLSTREVAERARLSNARVSRAETGRSLLSVPEVNRWAEVVGADALTRERLKRLVDEAHSPSVETFDPEQGESREQDYGAIEASAKRQISIARGVPGLLQTADYTAAMMRLADDTETRDIAPSVAARMERAAALFKGEKVFELLVSEADLRAPVVGPRAMAAQYDRIAQLSRLDGIRVGILPIGGEPVALLVSDADIFLDRADGEPSLVYIEMTHDGVWISQKESVERYVSLAERLWNSALTEDGARDLLASLAAEAIERS